MGFSESIRTCFSKYVDGKGRASRPEFWWWALFALIVDLVLEVGASITGSTAVIIIATIIVVVVIVPPGIAVAVRRLHDLDRSGWWWWLAFVPLVGGIILIVMFYVRPGTPGPNTYGPSPTEGGSLAPSA